MFSRRYSYNLESLARSAPPPKYELLDERRRKDGSFFGDRAVRQLLGASFDSNLRMNASEFRQQDNALLLIWIRAGNDSYAAFGCAEIIGQMRHADGNVDKISGLSDEMFFES